MTESRATRVPDTSDRSRDRWPARRFATPGPIAVSVEIGAGDIRVAASDRPDTVVEVRPSDPGRPADVGAAEHTSVECTSGMLVIRAPRRWTRYTPWGGSESVDVQISLPSGSSLRVDAGLGAVRCAGRVGDCEIRTGAGEIALDAAGSVHLRTGAGGVTADRVTGRLDIRTGTGSVRISAVDGPAAVRNATGDTWIGESGGTVQVNASFGRVSIDRARAGASVRTAHGDVRLGEVVRGEIVAQTGFGAVEVGVHDGIAAWLDLQANHGSVHNEMASAAAPGPEEESVEVRCRSTFGDITVRRS